MNRILRFLDFLNRDDVINLVMREKDISFVADRELVAAIFNTWHPDYHTGRHYSRGTARELASIVRHRFEIGGK